MNSINTSDWFYEFEYNGEKKRVHRFEHLPFDLALELREKGETGTLEVLAAVLKRDCGLELGDFDMDSMTALVDELAGAGESLGE